jgi:nucleotide-binding universal stress UspA family protein
MVCATAKYSVLNSRHEASPKKVALTKSGTTALPVPLTGDIRRILVPVDGSSVAEHALPHAISIARRCGASIRLVHVMSLLEPIDPWLRSHGPNSTDHYKREKHRYLNSLVGRVRSVVDGDIEDILIDNPDVVGAISLLTEPSTLVVMATGRRGFVKELIGGSTADELMNKMHGPMLLVRGSSAPTNLSSNPIPRHIVVPLDGAKCSEHVITPAALLGSLGGARFSLVHMGHPLTHRREISTAHEYLKAVALRSMKHAPTWDVEVMVSERNIASDLLEFAESNGADWIALTTHTRSHWDRLFGLSVAKSIVRNANIPILIVRHAKKRNEKCDNILTAWR